MIENINDSDRKRVMQPIKWAWITMFIIGLFFLIFYFLLKLSSVQNYLARTTTNLISNSLNTKVEIDEFNLNILHGLEFSGLYIEDRQGDTLLYVNKATTGFVNSFRSIYNKEFNVEEIVLEDGIINIRRGPNSPRSNLSELLYLPSNEQKPKKKSPIYFDLNLDQIHLRNISVSQIDSFNSQSISAHFVTLKARMDTFDLREKKLIIKNVDLNKPKVKVIKWRLPERDSSLLQGADDSYAVSQEEEFIDSTLIDSEIVDWDIKLNLLELTDGEFALQDLENKQTDYMLPAFSSANMNLEQINLKAENINFHAPYFLDGYLEELSVQSDNFKIEEANADRFFIEKYKAGFEELFLKTERSLIQDKVVFKYRNMEDWKDFINKILIDVELNNSSIAMRDLLYWVPTLQTNQFFQENINEVLRVSADISGRVNSLNVRKVNIDIGHDFALSGNLIGRNLADTDNAIVNARIDELSSTMSTISKLIPSFNPPQNFYKLGNINFHGRFDGFFQNFVAFGEATTDLGSVDVDLNLDLKNGTKNASYSGLINLYDFNLKKWTDNSNFGNLSVTAAIENGRGLVADLAYADLQGEILKFDFRDYTYSGVLNGKLERKLFDGHLAIDDENIKLDFQGQVDFQTDVPHYDFFADIENINLKALNLSKKITHSEGILNIDMKGKSIDDLVGDADVTHFVLYSETDSIIVDSIYLTSHVNHNVRNLSLRSNVLNADIKGDYVLTQLPDVSIKILKKHFPALMRDVDYIMKEPYSRADVEFSAEIINGNEIFDFFLNDSLRVNRTIISGVIDTDADILNTKIAVPHFQYKNIVLDSVSGNITRNELNNTIDLDLFQGEINGIRLEDVSLDALSVMDTVDFQIRTPRLLDSIQDINIYGKVVLREDDIILSLDEFIFNAMNSPWAITENASITFGKEFINLEHVALQGKNQGITFDDINANRGIAASIDEIDLSVVNSIINNDNVNFSGLVNTNLRIPDLYSFQGLEIEGLINDLSFNDNLLGTAEIDVDTDITKSKSVFSVKLVNDDKITTLEGYLNTKTNVTKASLDVQGIPLVIIESILNDAISRTQGEIYGDIDISGKIGDLNTQGSGYIKDGATNINYLGLYYTFDNTQFNVGKNYIDFSGAILTDIRGNTAEVTGGITHESFSDLGASCTIRSDNFIFLNTNKDLNPFYYGFVQGKADVAILGEFSDIKISIDAETGEDTKLFLPISSANKSRDNSFIPIMKKEEFLSYINGETSQSISKSDYVGLTLDLFVKVNPSAEMTIIFDDAIGHLLRGRGAGEIQMLLSPEGDISMYGNYIIESGIYDFAFTPVIKKRFFIQEDGRVSWNGDPLDATIDITAQYKQIRAPLTQFLREYLGGTSSIESAAQDDTDVDLTVYLTEKLLNPTVKFDINFPNLTGELKTYAESKMNALRSDPVGLNNQVFSLLIINNFYSHENSDWLGSGITTGLGEVLSSQVSDLASTMIEGLMSEQGFIYDLDVDVNLSKGSAGQSSEYGLTLKPKFNVDKLDISVGGDYYDTSTSNSNVESYLGGDLLIDYYLNSERTLKLRGYVRLDKDELSGQRRQRYGAGLYFRKGFNSLFGLEKRLRQLIRDDGLESKKE